MVSHNMDNYNRAEEMAQWAKFGCGILRTELNSQNHVRKKRKSGRGPPGVGDRGWQWAQEEP